MPQPSPQRTLADLDDMLTILLDLEADSLTCREVDRIVAVLRRHDRNREATDLLDVHNDTEYHHYPPEAHR